MKFEEIKRRLAKLDTACVCDANKSIRNLGPSIRLINSAEKLIGRARTVRCKDDFLAVIKALGESHHDDVLVIDGQGGTKALAGELFAHEAVRRGLAGIVIDGACRDIASIKLLSMPVYARIVNPMAGTTKETGHTQIAVVCGDATILPGDIVFGDQDGLIVASEEEFADVLDKAEELQRHEEKILESIMDGKSLLSMLNVDEHFQRVSNGEESSLRFTH